MLHRSFCSDSRRFENGIETEAKAQRCELHFYICINSTRELGRKFQTVEDMKVCKKEKKEKGIFAMLLPCFRLSKLRCKRLTWKICFSEDPDRGSRVPPYSWQCVIKLFSTFQREFISRDLNPWDLTWSPLRPSLDHVHPAIFSKSRNVRIMERELFREYSNLYKLISKKRTPLLLFILWFPFSTRTRIIVILVQ